jgi:hypothetical protein
LSQVNSPARVQAAIFALLACNTIYYIAAGRFSEALESVAWYGLLILFMLEALRPPTPRARAFIHGLRLLATLAILASAIIYVREKEWLDATNLFLWVAVVALLEIEIRRPAAVAAHRTAFTQVAALLYAALGVLVVIWLTRTEWMDAWDAALWLAAFGVLEMDLLRAK